MRTSGKQNTVVGRGVWKVVNSVPTRFVGVAMPFSRAILKWGLREIRKLDYLSDSLLRDSKGDCKRSSGKGIDNYSEESAVVMDPFSPVEGGIYMLFVTS